MTFSYVITERNRTDPQGMGLQSPAKRECLMVSDIKVCR